MKELLTVSAALCLGSFGWGMVRHFRREGPVTRAMKSTALLGVTCAALQFVGLFWHLRGCPAAALPLYGASFALFWWAVRVSRRKLAACGQGVTTQEILQTGPYRFIRHPFYTAYDLAWIGGFVATGGWPLALAVLVMGSIYEHSAREEEAGFAAGPLAPEYRDYATRTGKYLPRPRSLAKLVARSTAA